MQLLDKVTSNIILCGIELSFTGVAIPSVIDGWQPFFNSTTSEADFTKAYSTLSSIDYGEETNESTAGVSYKQKIVFRFPNSDENRSSRISLLQKIKFIKLKQTNGIDILIGRNDYFQNVLPNVKVKSNHQLTEVEIETETIFPTGYTPSHNAFGIPVLIPLTLVQ